MNRYDDAAFDHAFNHAQMMKNQRLQALLSDEEMNDVDQALVIDKPVVIPKAMQDELDLRDFNHKSMKVISIATVAIVAYLIIKMLIKQYL